MDSILEAQRDMRKAYANGVPGIITSGSIWICAGVVTLLVSPVAGILTLIVGGALIFPVSALICKMIGRSGKHSKANPLAPLALEGTLWMLLSIPIAISAAFYKLEWFFPAMMLVIAGRYLTFSTLYGLRIYWLLGIGLALSGFALAVFNAPVFVGGIAGGVVEIVFAPFIARLCHPAESHEIKKNEDARQRDL